MTTASIARNTITQEVYSRLKRGIIDRSLKPGARLIIDKIAGELGISLSPVRESLRMLEKDGLVQNVPHRGAVVTELTRQQFEDAFVVRRAIEGLAARLACQNADEQHLSQIAATVRSMDEAVAADDARAFADADMSFHQAVAAASGNTALEQIIDGVTVRIQAFLSLTVGDLSGALGDLAGPLRGRAQHGAILDALKGANPDVAERLMLEHIDESLERAVDSGRI